MQNLSTLLIANRGEIAVRVIHTAQRMGLATVAVFTDPDRDAAHVHLADRAVRVSAYLDIDEIVTVARDTGADAVHPGYGFLSERAEFATAVEQAGITLVGPTAEVMDQMGRKDAARQIALAAGVPVVPAGEPDDADGFPVLVKAAAGGGGKGMRVVRSRDELTEATEAAQREARTAFGDDTMLIEKYVERGRHIEVQVMADAHGQVIHLGERDCSVQRRHQKVVEEAPAVGLTDEQRSGLHEAAVSLAEHVGYRGAGTVEFLLDADTGSYYFLEMNTRLQVEHPVTEAVTGLDLVELQLRVADGQPLGITQAQVRTEGHAIEARIYAEDAFGGFLPQAGRAASVLWPQGPGVRVDAGLRSGQEVSTSYDPMLAKVIAHGPDRAAALTRLIGALDQTAITGLVTNAGFVRALLGTPEFASATIDTAWLDRNVVESPSVDIARSLAARHLARRATGSGVSPEMPLAADGFRVAGPKAAFRASLDVEVSVNLDEVARTVVHPTAQQGVDRVTTRVAEDSRADELVSGYVVQHPHFSEVLWRGQRFCFTAPDVAHDEGPVGDGALVAPMPGTVLDVRVVVGDDVEHNQVLAILEAMKMEIAVRAPFAGVVTEVAAAAGDQVAMGAALVRVEAGPQ